jgi:diguanylate cyclase (GGDEF)-like protein
MRLLDRPDAPLLVGLAVALIVLVVPTVTGLFDPLHALEGRLGVALLPAIVAAVAGALAFRDRQARESQASVAVAEVAKRESGRRTTETQRLVAFGHAVAGALDHDSMKAAINQHLSRLTGSSQSWVLVRQGPKLEFLAGMPAADQQAATRRIEFAEGILRGDRPGVTRDPRSGFPMVLGGTHVGLIGVESSGPLGDERERIVEAAASLLATSLKNVQVFRDVRETGVRDGLTGCWTRTHAMQVLDSELRRARRSGLPVSIILFDLDHFKAINDRFGHLCGDAVLAEVGKRFDQALRTSDLKCRYGGEEFLGVLPATPLHGAGCVAETLRRELAARPVSWNDDVLTVTASLGVTEAEPGELDMEKIIGRADAALYRAKAQGRNCVRFEPDRPPPLPEARQRADAATTPAESAEPG